MSSSALFQAKLLTSALKLAFQKSGVTRALEPQWYPADGSAQQQFALSTTAVLRVNCG